MRARRFRPNFDRLDTLLLLSDATPTVPPPATPSDTSTGTLPGDEVDPVVVVGWYGTGNPPADDDSDPTDPTTDGTLYPATPATP